MHIKNPELRNPYIVSSYRHYLYISLNRPEKHKAIFIIFHENKSLMLTWSHAQVKGEGVCCPGEPQAPPRTRSPLSSNSGVPCCQTHQDWDAAPRLTSLCPLSQGWQGRSLNCWPDPRSCRPSASVRHAIIVKCCGIAASGAPCSWGSNYLMQNSNDLRTYNIQSMNAIYTKLQT